MTTTAPALRSGVEVGRDVVEVGEDHRSLFLGASVVTATEQDHRRREQVRGGEEGAEVGVGGHHDTALDGGEREERFVVGCFESEVEGVDGVRPSRTEEVGESW